ncbi:hypothetical protein EI94DRAFT_1130890 [Lactarius quietus]|nr:hypothetical protein EI94DRAFT_1130890 [Lactarius quietus]
MQSPHDSSRGHSYHRHQHAVSSTHSPNYPDTTTAASPQAIIMPPCPMPIAETLWGPQEHIHSVMATSNPSTAPGYPIAHQSGSSISHQYLPQHYASDGQQAVLLNPGVPSHYQNYRPIEHGQPIVPSQPHGHGQYGTPQKPYPNPRCKPKADTPPSIRIPPTIPLRLLGMVHHHPVLVFFITPRMWSMWGHVYASA